MVKWCGHQAESKTVSESKRDRVEWACVEMDMKGAESEQESGQVLGCSGSGAQVSELCVCAKGKGPQGGVSKNNHD